MNKFIAIRTITSILGTYEKLKLKLEKAIDSLKNVQKENVEKISDLEREFNVGCRN